VAAVAIAAVVVVAARTGLLAVSACYALYVAAAAPATAAGSAAATAVLQATHCGCSYVIGCIYTHMVIVAGDSSVLLLVLLENT
jgi:hypothetical protein